MRGRIYFFSIASQSFFLPQITQIFADGFTKVVKLCFLDVLSLKNIATDAQIKI
jgi:hypothetical protein